MAATRYRTDIGLIVNRYPARGGEDKLPIPSPKK